MNHRTKDLANAIQILYHDLEIAAVGKELPSGHKYGPNANHFLSSTKEIYQKIEDYIRINYDANQLLNILSLIEDSKRKVILEIEVLTKSQTIKVTEIQEKLEKNLNIIDSIINQFINSQI